MAFEDKTLTCVDCKAPFTFSARDQEFHAEKGFTNEPKRCASCRQARRLQRGDAPPMAARTGQQPVYSGPRAQSRPAPRNDRGGGRPRGRHDGDRRDRRDGGENTSVSQRSFGGESQSTVYMAQCAACGKETAAPPDGSNRVAFCNECYEKMTALTRS